MNVIKGNQGPGWAARRVAEEQARARAAQAAQAARHAQLEARLAAAMREQPRAACEGGERGGGGRAGGAACDCPCACAGAGASLCVSGGALTGSFSTTWLPLVKVAFSGTVSALVLLLVAEREHYSGSPVSFGVLSALGISSLLIAVPLVHWAGARMHRDGAYQLFQPFRGGARFVALQAVGWTFYGALFLTVTGSVVWAEHTASGLLASAGVLGVLSQAFMVSSLLVYAPDKAGAAHEGSFLASLDSEQSASIASEFVKMNTALALIGSVLAMVSEVATARGAAPLMAALSLICSIAAVLLTHGVAGRVRHGRDGWCFAQAFRGGRRFVAMQAAGWGALGVAVIAQSLCIVSSVYLGTQVISEVMYVGALAAVLSFAVIAASLRAFQPPARAARAASVGLEAAARAAKVSTETATASPAAPSVREAAGSAPAAPGQAQAGSSQWDYRALPQLGALERARLVLLIAVICNTHFYIFGTFMVCLCLPYVVPRAHAGAVARATLHLVPELDGGELGNFAHTFEVWLSLFASTVGWIVYASALKTLGVDRWRLSLLMALGAVLGFGATLRACDDSPHRPMMTLLIALLCTYLSSTFSGRPETNASREWPALRNSPLWDELFGRYFGLQLLLSRRVRPDVAAQLGDARAEDPALQQAIVLFHPHSIFPLSHIGLGLTKAWKTALPHLRVNPLTASIIHYVPVMRELQQWLGSCDVSRHTVDNLLRMGRSIQIVCGGQTEMFESRSWDTQICLVRARRLGIFRIAIQHGLPLVPLYSFGETLTFDNVYLPRVQGWFKSIIGIPVPFLMLGAYGLPVPRRVPVSVAVGPPVHPLQRCQNPTPEQVQELQQRYFDALQLLFDEFKSEAGHGHCTIRWIDN